MRHSVIREPIMCVSLKAISWSCGTEVLAWLALTLPSVGVYIFTFLHIPSMALARRVPMAPEEFWVLVPLQILIWFVIWYIPLKIEERVHSRRGHTDG